MTNDGNVSLDTVVVTEDGVDVLTDYPSDIESLTIDPVDRSRFRVEVLSAALGLVESNGADTTVLIGGRPAAERLAVNAFRRGDWKLLVDGDDLLLFNLRNDIGERHDLAARSLRA